ncbi:hypothetical protein IHE44_0014094 [Lamprotornis superbus]|uniref:Tetraspanin-4 n=1 Tax=Lamprotornis superbus TaxID=245042 RepID=A0A835TUV2_9PASS|nr:hypothetical protein IHE44_0014094 [Lamprotornis superbus]
MPAFGIERESKIIKPNGTKLLQLHTRHFGGQWHQEALMALPSPLLQREHHKPPLLCSVNVILEKQSLYCDSDECSLLFHTLEMSALQRQLSGVSTSNRLGGCGILGVGIWLAVTQGNFATLSSSFPSLSAANLLIVTGTFVMIIGFVGCIGAIKENKCLLLSFFIMLLIIFLLELTVVILFFVYTDKIDKYAQRDLKKGLHLYGTDGNIGLTNAWSIIQTDFRCCGVSNYTDWFEVYNTSRVPDSCCLEFSENCGLHSPGTWWKAPCYETVKIWLQENLLAVGIFGLCTAMVQILGLTFAMTMYCQMLFFQNMKNGMALEYVKSDSEINTGRKLWLQYYIPAQSKGEAGREQKQDTHRKMDSYGNNEGQRQKETGTLLMLPLMIAYNHVLGKLLYLIFTAKNTLKVLMSSYSCAKKKLDSS